MVNQTKNPHVHAECIKAWAEGIQIEFRTDLRYGWRELRTPHPYWQEDFEYRIKPEPKPDFCRYGIISSTPHPGGVFKPDGYCVVFSGSYMKQIEGTNLKLTFDGETGKLKKTEVIG